MVRVLGGAALTALIATSAYAGGLERSSQSVGILFEKGTYAEFSVGRVAPDVSGSHSAMVAPVLGTASSGDMTGDYTTTSFGFKAALNEQFDLAFILDSPIGADVKYKAGTGYIYGGSTATIDSTAMTMLARYKLPSNFSVHGGLRFQRAEGKVALFNGYTMNTDTSSETGFVLGAAWEKPEIAARVALTYNSAITHNFNATENIAPVPTQFKTEIPQSLNLEFQSGIAADTLLFGSVRWVEWSKTDITPLALFTASGSSLVDYDDDTITYNIGVGRRFSDSWSGAVTLAHEPGTGGFSGNLGPTDGYTSVGLAATYTHGNMKITGGARYVWIGDAKTEAPASLAPAGTTLGEFKDNSGVAFGVKVGYTF
ncbi:MAG: outer membrane protein transport protein [Paracoccaceae bacterium]